MPFYWNPTYWLFVAPALLFMLYAQWRVKSAYSKWDKVANARHMTGTEVAQRLMAETGLQGLNVRGIPGHLTDNYDPSSKTLNLSETSVREGSVASMAVVAHEMGHAMQDANHMALLRLRAGLVPAVNFGSQLGPILFIVGYFLQFSPIMWLGIAFFSMAFVFALVTLPVEIDASSRAIRLLSTSGMIVGEDEKRGARQVLTAAALTYVAALLMSLMQLLYYVTLARGGRRRR